MVQELGLGPAEVVLDLQWAEQSAAAGANRTLAEC
jgi:hypothetical protein